MGPTLLELLALETVALLHEARPDVAPGPFHGPAEALLARVLKAGARTLADLARSAVTRWLQHGPGVLLSTVNLFDREETAALADSLAATTGTAEMLGRALVRDHQRRLLRRHGLTEAVDAGSEVLHEALGGGTPVLSPERAVEYFRNLVPTLGTDPQRFGADQRRRAFTLAAATDEETLVRVQAAVRDRLEKGDSVDGGAKAVQAVLDDAGVTTANDSYARLVYRTNAVESMNQGAWEEMQDPDVASSFPAWRYEAITDNRARPTHAARNGKLYPASMPFNVVRGTGPEDVCNCRCTFTPVFRTDLEEFLASGGQLETSR